MAAFKTEVDVANRALQHLRVRRIRGFTDQSLAATETGFAYSRLREVELKEHLWRFSTRRAIMYAIGPSTYLWTPPTWSAGTYTLGQVVVDANGDWWQAKKASVTSTPAMGADWWRYFGSDVMAPFVAQSTNLISAPAAPTMGSSAGGGFGPRTVVAKVTYIGAAGESQPSASTKDVLLTNQLTVVTSPSAAAGATQYNVYAGENAAAVVLQNASPINLATDWTEPGTGLSPNGAAPPPSSPLVFNAGDLTSLNGVPYLSLVGSNADTPPSVNWVVENGTIAALKILYPLGAGPVSSPQTLNVYRLPRGYLRQAPTDPKRAASTFLGAIQGNVREDWVFEGDYLVSRSPGPLVMRYVADFVDVPDMDASFCEMLSARIAEEIGPLLVQEPTLLSVLLSNARAHYERERRDATSVNSIETGPIDLEADDYLTCRL